MDRCLIRAKDRVVILSKDDMNLIVDVCNNWIKETKKRIDLLDDNKMIGNLLLIELIDDIRCLVAKIEG